MTNGKRSLIAGGVAAALLGAGWSASAQESANQVIGPPQLKDFRLAPREGGLVQPQPQAQPQPQTQPPQAERPPPAPPQAAPERRVERPSETPARAPTAAPVAASEPPQRQPVAEEPSPAPAQALPTLVEDQEAPAPIPADLPEPAPVQREAGGSIWMFALPAAALAFLGLALVRRRRRSSVEPAASVAAIATAPPAPPKPRPDPVPRPWLELELKAERAAFTASEAEILFELEIANKGGSAARNLRVDVKIFNAGAEQDKEIGAFFRTAGRESTKLNLPGVDAGVTGVLSGRVAIPVEEMKAVRLDERLLFIPVVAVNVLYDWGEGRTGQTSRSYLVGRELQTPSEKMGAFRVDQGPRVWRTVGQREHKLKKRV